MQGAEDDLRRTVSELKQENALLRGVLDVLRVDLQIKDDQIDKLYQSLRNRECPLSGRTAISMPSPPPSTVTLPIIRSPTDPPVCNLSINRPFIALPHDKPTERSEKQKPAGKTEIKSSDSNKFLDSIHDDVLKLVLSFADVSTNISIRRVCVRLSRISRFGMNNYWENAWIDVRGIIPRTVKMQTSNSLSWKQEFRWYQLGSRPIISTLNGHKGSVTSLAFADLNDREMLVSGSDDGSLIVWCTSDERQKEEEVRPVIMQHHHRQSKGDNVYRLHSLVGHHGPVWGVSVDGNHVASGSFDKTVKVWDLSSGNCLQTLRGHENWVSCVSLKDNTILSGSWDSTVRIWRIEGAQARHMGNLPTEAGNAVYAIDRAGCLVASGSHQRRLEVFNIETRQLVRRFDNAHAGKTYAVQFQSVDIVATGGCDGKARVWDLRSPSDSLLHDISAHTKPVLGVRMGDVHSAPYRLATCSGDYSVKVFDVRKLKESVDDTPAWLSLRGKRATAETTFQAHSTPVFALCMDDAKICSGGADGSVKVFRF